MSVRIKYGTNHEDVSVAGLTVRQARERVKVLGIPAASQSFLVNEDNTLGDNVDNDYVIGDGCTIQFNPINSTMPSPPIDERTRALSDDERMDISRAKRRSMKEVSDNRSSGHDAVNRMQEIRSIPSDPPPFVPPTSPSTSPTRTSTSPTRSTPSTSPIVANPNPTPNPNPTVNIVKP